MAAEISERPLHVLQVVQSVGGGVWRHVFDLIAGLKRRGVRCSLAYSPRGCTPAMIDEAEACGAERVFAIPMTRSPGPSDAIALGRLIGAIRASRPLDLLHGQSSKGGALARMASVLTGVPAVYTPNAFVTMDPTLSSTKRAVFGTIERGLSWMCRGIIAVSDEEKVHAGKLGIDANKVVVVPNGVAGGGWPSREAARQAIGVPSDATVVGFIGRMAPQKAPEAMVEAFAIALKTLPHLTLAMVGDGPLMESTRATAKRLGVTDRIKFLGDRKGTDVIAAFDLYAMSSRYEGFPYVLIEALHAGLPIVTTEVGGARAMVEDGGNGRVVAVGDMTALAEGIVETLGDPEVWRRRGDRSRELSPRFTIDTMVDRTLAFYSKVLRRPVLGEATGAGESTRAATTGA